MSAFSISTIADTQVTTDPKNNIQEEQNSVETLEPEDTDNFNCTLECHRRCEKKEMEAVDCSNNGCKCAPG